MFVVRQNKTVGPDACISENEPAMSPPQLHTILLQFLTYVTAVEAIRNNMAARQNDMRLYLDVIDLSKVIESNSYFRSELFI